MKEPLAVTLLLILGAVVNLIAAFCCAALMAWTDLSGAVKLTVIIAVFVLNIAVLARAHKRFYWEYAHSAPKFVLLGTAPSVLLSLAGFVVIDVMKSLGAFGAPPSGAFDFRGLNEFAFAAYITFYAVSVAVGLFVTLGISHVLNRQ